MKRRIGFLVSACLFFGLAAGPVRSGEVPDALTTFASAKVVLGQNSFTTNDCNPGGNPSAHSLCSPSGAAAFGKKVLYIPDSNNARVLGFKKIPKKSGASAKFVLGQTNFTNRNFGLSSTSFDSPTATATDGKHLFMNDFGNNRVLIWNTLPTKTDTPANVVLGQTDFTSNASKTTKSGLEEPEEGLFVAGGKLFVSDRNNNRIMIWNTIPTSNGADANVVVGQPDFTSNQPATTRTGLGEPEGLWSDGTRLVVADFDNSRVLIWNTIPTTNGAPADVVVGQADFTSSEVPEPPTAQSLDEPGGVFSDGTRLFVEDSRNNRILVFNTFPTSNNPTADIVLGQADFTHSDSNAGNAAPNAQTLSFPFGISIVGTQLIVDDEGNERFLIFNTK
jgi:hypothetical protein